MAFPPEYPYPAFLNALRDRLHPGTTWRGGGRDHRDVRLRAGYLWRVGTPIGYPSVLYLFSITRPDYYVRLDAELARCLLPIELSEYFTFARCREWYKKFDALGVDLWAVDNRQDNYVILFLYSYFLPASRNRMECTLSRFAFGPHVDFEQLSLSTLYEELSREHQSHQQQLDREALYESNHYQHEKMLSSKLGLGSQQMPRSLAPIMWDLIGRTG